MGALRKNRRTTAKPTSVSGSASAISGAANPTSVTVCWLHTSPKQPNMKPTVKLPQSPKKTEAGLKL